jgi:hypothetical protein
LVIIIILFVCETGTGTKIHLFQNKNQLSGTRVFNMFRIEIGTKIVFFFWKNWTWNQIPSGMLTCKTETGTKTVLI